METIAQGLKGLAGESIFIGGACAQFYVKNPDLHDFRPTRDIDCIVKVHTYREFAACSDSLRSLGFTNDTTPGAPIVRWIFKGIPVDIIPDRSSVVGFRDIVWFSEGRKYKEERILPSGRSISILPLVFYLAAKLESWQDRGGGDFLASKDIEDIVCIIDGIDDLEILLKAPSDVRAFVLEQFAKLITNMNFKQAIAAHIGFDESAVERARIVVDKMADVVLRGVSDF